MPGEEIDTVSERLNTGTDVVATTSSSEDEGYSGDYFSEESENENFSLPREETHHVRKVLKLRRRHRSSDPPSVPSSVVWYDSDDFTHESEVPPSAHEDGQPEDNNSDTTLEATLGEQCQHPCCLRPLSDSDHGQQHPYRCACGPSYSRSSPDSESASEQRIEGPLESYFNEQHSNELERFLRLGFQSPRHSMRSPDNNGPHGMVINTAETHYDIWDPQSSSHAIISGFICYRALPCMSSTNELTWLSIETHTTFGNNTDPKYFMLLENTTMNEATFRRASTGSDGQPLPSRLPQHRAASSPFYNFLSPLSVLHLQVEPITSQYGTPVCTFLLIFPVGDPFFFPTDQVGHFSRKIKIECKGHVNIRESDGCMSIAQVSQTAEVVVHVKRTKVMRNGVWIHFEAPV